MKFLKAKQKLWNSKRFNHHYHIIFICDLPVAILFGLHLDATIVDVAVETGNCHCHDQLQMVAVIVAQSVAAQTVHLVLHHAVHLVEWQMALVKFEKSLAAEVIVAAAAWIIKS